MSDRDASEEQTQHSESTILEDELQLPFKSAKDQDLIRGALHKSALGLTDEQVERFVAVAVLKSFRSGEAVILEGCVDRSDEEPASADESATVEAIEEDWQQVEVLPDDGPAEAYDEDEDHRDLEEPLEFAFHENAIADPTSIPVVGAAAVGTTDNGSADPTESVNAEDSKTGELNSRSLENGDEISSHSGDTSLDQSTRRRDPFDIDTSSETRPPPPQSGTTRSLYIIQSGRAGVWYERPHVMPATLGPGTLFGQGGFLFGRPHSASVLAQSDLSCWVVDWSTFCQYVLPTDDNRRIFAEYSQKHGKSADGRPYMTMADMEQAHGTAIPLMAAPNTETHKIFWEDYLLFSLLLARPDAQVDFAFALLDHDGTGQIHRKDVERVVQVVDSQSDLFLRYFGQDGRRSLRRPQFSQFLVDLQTEVGLQAFTRAMQEHGLAGHLGPAEFVELLVNATPGQIPSRVVQRLRDLYLPLDGPVDSDTKDQETRISSSGDHFFTFADFVAFTQVLCMLPAVCDLIDRAEQVKEEPLSADDVLTASYVMGNRMSRRQVEVIFALFDVDENGYISHKDAVSVCGDDQAQRLLKGPSGKLLVGSVHDSAPREATDDTSVATFDLLVTQMGVYTQQLGFMSIATTLGIAVLYPFDLVKTRMMNQRIKLDGSRMYQSALQCFQQGLRVEGFAGLYRGLTPQLLGVLPEKAIKVQVNDMVRQALSSNAGLDPSKINWTVELLAGAAAGACPLLVVNPMEVAKIRLQLQGETARLVRERGIPAPALPSLRGVMRSLGFVGAYRGASACLMRDIPFSAIYFSAFAACKDALVDQHRHVSSSATATDILLAGTLAGIPAAILTTPADVIKTRLQAIPRPGEAAYAGIRDTFAQVYRKEGLGAFFQGSLTRTLRIAPQFGVSLLAYEQLTSLFAKDSLSWTPHPPTDAPIDPIDYHSAFRRK